MSTETDPRAIATDLIRSAASDIDTMGISEYIEGRDIDDPGAGITEQVDELIRKATVLVDWPATEPTAEPTGDVAVLREAAQQMRQRAAAATGHNWNSDHGGLVYTVDTDDIAPVAVTLSAKPADVAHIAGWGPATALAVADWLDSHATDLASAGGNRLQCDSPGDLDMALKVARAYLDSGWDGDPYPR